MVYSEWSTHHNISERLRPLRTALKNDGHKVQVRKDVVLVMGDDEDDLLKLTVAATFCVQTQPWRLEIDFWKSYVNVDLKFLDALKDEWWL